MTVLDARGDVATVDQIVARAARPDYGRWAEQVEHCGHCSRPVRLVGRVEHHTSAGHRTAYTTDAEPDRVLMIRCGNRRASVCSSCSYEYAGDMWQLLYAGAAGGRKGVPDSIRAHPLVFATLTAPGFGPVHTTRTDRRGNHGHCRPPKGKPRLCDHGRPTWCSTLHPEDDERLGQPLCPECYDYTGHVAFNWHAPELWRRFTIALPRVLARRCGVSAAEFRRRCRVSFVKVAEYQRRAVVHFHALIRLDGPGDDYQPSDLPLGAVDLADAIREAAGLARLTVDLPDAGVVIPTLHPGTDSAGFPTSREGNPGADDAHQQPVTLKGHQARGLHRNARDREHRQINEPDPGTPTPSPECGKYASDPHTRSIHSIDWLTLRFGTQVDTQPINGGPDGELTPERVAAYIAKYATKSADDFGVGDRRISLDALPQLDINPHVERIIRTAWDLGADPSYDGIRRWLHMLGFRGHFASKSRRYSTTLGAIRGERREYRRRQAAEHTRLLGEPDPYDDDTTLVIARWQFAGLGYLTGGDAALALSAASRAREHRQAARDATA